MKDTIRTIQDRIKEVKIRKENGEDTGDELEFLECIEEELTAFYTLIYTQTDPKEEVKE